MIPEVDLAIVIAGNQENSPAVLRHADISKVRPAVLVDADRGAQIDLQIGAVDWTGVVPPAQERRLPALQRTLQCAVAGEFDVVRDLL